MEISHAEMVSPRREPTPPSDLRSPPRAASQGEALESCGQSTLREVALLKAAADEPVARSSYRGQWGGLTQFNF